MANFIPKIEYIEIFTAIAKTITFETPPDGDPTGEEDIISSVVTRSNNGEIQTQFNNIRTKEGHEFIFVSKTIKEEVQDMIRNHSSRGGEVNYFIHSDEVEFETVKYTDKKLRYRRDLADGNGDFLYRFKLNFERKVP